MDAANTIIRPKEPIKFRPLHLAPALEEMMQALRQRQPGVEISNTLRDGLEAFLPQISAYLQARQMAPVGTAELVQLTGVCAKAIELGVTAKDLERHLSTLIEQKLAS